MSLFSLSPGLPVMQGAVANSPIFDIWSEGGVFSVIEISIMINGAFGGTIGIGRASNTPTQVNGINLLPEDVDGVQSKAKVAVTWSVLPAAPTAYYRRSSPATAVGAGIIWAWPRGLTVPKRTSLVLFSIAGSGSIANGFSGAHAQITE